jgi:hypothetical protein
MSAGTATEVVAKECTDETFRAAMWVTVLSQGYEMLAPGAKAVQHPCDVHFGAYL